MDFGKNASFSKYKKLLGKVFGFNKATNEEDKEGEEEGEQDGKNENGKMSKELGVMKTLVLDLSNVVTHLNGLQGKTLLLNYIKQPKIDKFSTSIEI